MLDPVPAQPIHDGTPAFGTYAGRCPDTDLALAERGVSRLRRFRSEKAWQWFAAFDNSLAVGGAIVDAGFFGTAFCWVVDRETGRLVADEDVILPPGLCRVSEHPTEGRIARVGVPSVGPRLQFVRAGDTVTVEGEFGGVDIALELTVEDERAISAICPVAGRSRGVNVTQKEPGVDVVGTVRVAGDRAGEAASRPDRTRSIDGVGFLDYSHGLLGRETRWDWAFGWGTASDGTPVGFNLVDRFNDGRENVVWVDGRPERVGAATLETGEEWRVRTDCGTVDATLAVEARREQHVDVGLVRSSYDQPLGRWSGTVAGHEFEGVGVAEEHATRW